MALVSLVRHHITPSLLFLIFMVERPCIKLLRFLNSINGLTLKLRLRTKNIQSIQQYSFLENYTGLGSHRDHPSAWELMTLCRSSYDIYVSALLIEKEKIFFIPQTTKVEYISENAILIHLNIVKAYNWNVDVVSSSYLGAIAFSKWFCTNDFLLKLEENPEMIQFVDKNKAYRTQYVSTVKTKRAAGNNFTK